MNESRHKGSWAAACQLLQRGIRVGGRDDPPGLIFEDPRVDKAIAHLVVIRLRYDCLALSDRRHAVELNFHVVDVFARDAARFVFGGRKCVRFRVDLSVYKPDEIIGEDALNDVEPMGIRRQPLLLA